MDNVQKQIISTTYREQIEIWYKSHNIIQEKCELYYDFLSSLLNLINETYLGINFITSDEDMVNHFNWCFNRIISNFEQERIYFNNKNEHYDYLWVFFYKAYYTCVTENKTGILSDYFKILFNFNKVKTPSELESFTDIYKLLDQNLKKIN